MKKAVIYTRFSERPDAATSESCEYQEEFCRDWCENNGFTVIGAYRDEGISGATPIEKRPGLESALCTLKSGNALVVFHWDRLARDRLVHVAIDSFVNGMGGHMISASNGQSTRNESPEDELLRGIMQNLSGYQRKIIAMRTRTAMLSYQKNGRIMSKQLPYGFKVNKKDPKHMVKCPVEQDTLAIIRERHDAGWSNNRIAKALNTAGRKPRTAKEWSRNTIRKIVRRDQSNIA